MCEEYAAKRSYEKIQVKNPKRKLCEFGKVRNHYRYQAKEHDLPEKLVRQEWKSVEAEKQDAQTQLRESLKSFFENEIELVLKRLKEKFGIKQLRKFSKKATKPEDFNLVMQTLLDWSRWFGLTKQTARPGLIVIVDRGYETGALRSGANPSNLTLPSETVENIDPTTGRVSQGRGAVFNVIQEILEKTARTQQTFRRTAAREIQQGLQEGRSLSEIVGRVANKTEEQVGYKLDRIVQTAGNGGFEVGEIEGMKDAGIERGTWVSQRDPRVRTPANGDLWNHRSADGQESDLNVGWVISGKGSRQETLRFPSDPLGSPGNTIYCRCGVNPSV